MQMSYICQCVNVWTRHNSCLYDSMVNVAKPLLHACTLSHTHLKRWAFTSICRFIIQQSKAYLSLWHWLQQFRETSCELFTGPLIILAAFLWSSYPSFCTCFYSRIGEIRGNVSWLFRVCFCFPVEPALEFFGWEGFLEIVELVLSLVQLITEVQRTKNARAC